MSSSGKRHSFGSFYGRGSSQFDMDYLVQCLPLMTLQQKYLNEA